MTSLNTAIANGAKRALYASAQAARIVWHTGHYAAGRRAMGPLTQPGNVPQKSAFSALNRARLRDAFREAFTRDWAHIAAGTYKMPREVTRPPSPARLWRESRDYLRDTHKVARRHAARNNAEVLTEATAEKYPRYYLQNFHYQTDGWLSAASAERYDMQVETLFTGAAGAMRRAGLPFIAEFLDGRDISDVCMLDLGCGAGAFLGDVKQNWPALDVTGLDLSPAYLGKARARLSRYKNLRFVEANAEATGLPDQSFDIISCVYLFHELPPKIRRVVAAEMGRLLKPGGIILHTGNIQYGDEEGLDVLLEFFPRGFHEPYFDSYCREDLDTLYAEVGLAPAGEALSFLTKARVFRG